MKKQKKSNSSRRTKKNPTHPPNERAENRSSDIAPYKVLESETLGRYLVAARDLSAGEVVMSDQPLVVGPCQEAQPLCIGCYVNIDLKDPQFYCRCKTCSWPLCSSLCPGYHLPHGHSKEECDLLSKCSLAARDVSTFSEFYYAITPLRCLVKKINEPETWKILNSMETHTEKRKHSTELWKANEKFAVNIIRNALKLTEFTDEEIHFACGVLEVNAFELSMKPGMQCLRAIYSKAFLFAHDCVPNCSRSNGSDFRLNVRTMRAIPADEIITISYAYTLQCTLLRRKHLKETKFFHCLCKRCSDPTELGTYAGAMKCPTCTVGVLLPEHPLDENSTWSCSSQKCNHQLQVTQIIPLLDKLFKELDSINGNDIVGYENFVQKCSTRFHDNHYLSLSAMHCLSQLYGKINGFLINDLTDEQLERKKDICRRLLKIFDKLEPGLSKQRGILLYELQAPIMVLLRKRFQNIPKKELKSKLKTVLKYLEESFLILKTEPENSVEGQMAAAAKEGITGLQEWLNILQ